MSKTAYSLLNSKELDVEQLLALYGNHTVEESIQVLSNIPDHIRTLVGLDVLCPSCGVDGAILVSGAKSKATAKSLRQAHFRFVGAKNEDAHLPFCDFSPVNTDEPKQSELVDLQSDRSQETRFVRQLVCKGIESKVFDQSDIRSMRQWYFDLKAAARFRVTTSIETLTYLYKLIATDPHNSLAHHPAHAEIPGFDWRYAARSKLSQDNADLILAARGIGFGDVKKDAARLIVRYKDREVFDVEVLEPHYEKTIQLCMFAGRSFGYSDRKWMNYRWGQIPSSLLALCSLLLSVSDWDIDRAIDKLAVILNAPPPNSLLHGNIMGLNPFLEYGAWRLIKRVSVIEKNFAIPHDFDAQISNMEATLRAEHLQWRRTNGLPDRPPKEIPIKTVIPLNEMDSPFLDL
ncbi:hypothetical protein [Pseudomonas sp. RA_105y_Pfl2_P56]|uniref:hypothetical protein n=1 Tax=Pseudomonas sp. RA_105y_Pfl2_P56 TaxID=3088701 RepID=UPI0030D8163D